MYVEQVFCDFAEGRILTKKAGIMFDIDSH